jgi:hypothetical protein
VDYRRDKKINQRKASGAKLALFNWPVFSPKMLVSRGGVEKNFPDIQKRVEKIFPNIDQLN